jgi:dihydrofolate reductase
MRKLVSHLIMTLDGVVKLDGVMDSIMQLRDEAVEADFFAKVAQEDAMLLGRVTYQEWAGFWPTSNIEPFASHINKVPKYIVSETLGDTPWGAFNNATLLKGSLAQALTALKQQRGKNIGIHGSPKLVEWLLQADLLDELRLEIYPVLAGSGTRLFQEGRPSKALQLVSSITMDNGVVVLTYRPVAHV